MLKKLKSNTGVSIMIALLLFLVCAVIGSIVLAAATAASGRVSGLEESDRRYYAVTSAAELFRDALDGKELTVTREAEQDQTYTWYDDGNKSNTPDEPAAAPSYAFRINGTAISGSNESILTKATLDYVLGGNRATAEGSAMLDHTPGADFAWTEKTYTVTTSDDTALEVTATVKDNGSGALLFTFENEGDQKFTVSFTLTPSCSFLKDPQTWTKAGYPTSEIIALVDGEGNPRLDEAGNPRTQTKFTQTDTVYTDKSVVVTWTASPIVIPQGGTA